MDSVWQLLPFRYLSYVGTAGKKCKKLIIQEEQVHWKYLLLVASVSLLQPVSVHCCRLYMVVIDSCVWPRLPLYNCQKILITFSVYKENTSHCYDHMLVLQLKKNTSVYCLLIFYLCFSSVLSLLPNNYTSVCSKWHA